MNKKNLVKISYLIITLLVVITSCSKSDDEVLGISGGETMLVSFTLEQPVMQTRAFSDGLTATTLTYAVYKAGDRNCLLKSEDEVTFTDRVATVDIRLEKEQYYDILFWADAPDISCYVFDENAQTITINYSGITSGYEAMDAFYGAEKNLYVDSNEATGGVINKTVTLTRPFAQLNIGATDYSESALINTYTKCAVVIDNIPNILNLYSGDVSNTTTGDDAHASFAYTDFIGAAESFPVTIDDVDIEYLGMYYLLMSTSKTIGKVTVRFGSSDRENILIEEIENVPFQRNYRTNLYGNFLTDDVRHKIMIGPTYEIPDYDEEYNIPDL